MDFFSYIKDWINNNPGKALGGFAGFIFGILILTVGIIKTLLILLFIVIGIIIGKIKDDNISIFGSLPGKSKKKKYEDIDPDDF